MAFTSLPIATADSALTGSEGVAALQKAHDMPSAADVTGIVTGITINSTYTVGAGGDYTTINAALESLSKTKKQYNSSNPLIVLSLLTGFVMAEQVVCDGVDFSWVSITSVDAEVVITRSALSTLNIANLDYDSAPTFLAVNGGKLPVIAALFNMDSSGTATNRHGVMAAWGGFVRIDEGCGVKNAGSRGLYAVNGIGYARNTIWDGAGTRGIRASNASLLNVRGASATGCGEYNLAISGASVVTASGIDVSNGLGTNVLVDNASSLNADSIICSGAAVNGMDIKFGSQANVYLGNFSGCGVRAIDCVSSVIEMENANCASAGSTSLVVNKGSNVNAQGVTATTAGNTVAVSCTASRLNFKNGTSTSTGAQPIRCFDGSSVTATGATGGFNLTANTVTAEGIIFQ
jgi:hypothetical protein